MESLDYYSALECIFRKPKNDRGPCTINAVDITILFTIKSWFGFYSTPMNGIVTTRGFKPFRYSVN